MSPCRNARHERLAFECGDGVLKDFALVLAHGRETGGDARGDLGRERRGTRMKSGRMGRSPAKKDDRSGQEMEYFFILRHSVARLIPLSCAVFPRCPPLCLRAERMTSASASLSCDPLCGCFVAKARWFPCWRASGRGGTSISRVWDNTNPDSVV